MATTPKLNTSGFTTIKIAFGGVVTAETFALPTLGGAPRATLGTNHALEFSGGAGNLVAPFLAPVLAPVLVLVLPGIDGAILIDSAHAFLLTPAILDGAGLAISLEPVPNYPALTGLGLTFQFVEVGNGFLRASNPLTAVALP